MRLIRFLFLMWVSTSKVNRKLRRVSRKLDRLEMKIDAIPDFDYDGPPGIDEHDPRSYDK